MQQLNTSMRTTNEAASQITQQPNPADLPPALAGASTPSPTTSSGFSRFISKLVRNPRQPVHNPRDYLVTGAGISEATLMPTTPAQHRNPSTLTATQSSHSSNTRTNNSQGPDSASMSRSDPIRPLPEHLPRRRFHWGSLRAGLAPRTVKVLFNIPMLLDLTNMSDA